MGCQAQKSIQLNKEDLVTKPHMIYFKITSDEIFRNFLPKARFIVRNSIAVLLYVDQNVYTVYPIIWSDCS